MSPGRTKGRSEVDQMLASLGFDVGQETQTGSGDSGSEKPKVRNSTSQWDFEDSKRARSLSGLPPMSKPKAIQTEGYRSSGNKIFRDRTTQTSHGKSNKSVAVQAFEEDPWSGLLSRKEICEMVKVDDLVGLGYKEHPQATFEEHSTTSKRMIVEGVVYQVIIVKELYVEDHLVTEGEKSKRERGSSKAREPEVVEVIEIADESTSEEKEKEVLEKKGVEEEKKERKKWSVFVCIIVIVCVSLYVCM